MDRRCLIRPRGCLKHPRSRLVRDEIVGELLRVQRTAGGDEVVDGLRGRQAQREPDVPELEVEVVEYHPLARFGERDSEARRHEERAPLALFGPSTMIIRPLAARGPAVARRRRATAF